MSDLAIRVESLSKLYHIGRLQGRHDTLRDALTDALRGPLNGLRRNGHAPRPLDDTIWALRDISFEVKRGEVLGVIGRNGAGKSTLLKILSRITEPTSGRAVIHGRVGSLLEVGTGFHPELTGRENVFLNGAILGMKRVEIERKFDEIVAFAEIEKFLDTPVKRYSSGMYVRLAFAVAAHLEPEILLVDEVLAVGDAQFQKKCLGKMGEVAHEGRTVLFVSHNLDAIQQLCGNSILLKGGRLAAAGPADQIIRQYSTRQDTESVLPNRRIDLSNALREGSGEARFVAFSYSSLNESLDCRAYPDGPLELTLEIMCDTGRIINCMAIIVYSPRGTKLVNADIGIPGEVLALKTGDNVVRMRIEQLHLTPGQYVLGLCLADQGGRLDLIESAADFEVVDVRLYAAGIQPSYGWAVTSPFRLLSKG